MMNIGKSFVFLGRRVLNNFQIFRHTHMLKEEVVHINSQKINYLKVGYGENNILCFPGSMGSIWSDFQAQIEGFDRNTFTIIAWDPLGHGNSRPPERQFGWNFYEEDADILHELMQKLGIKSFSLLGWSDGGVSGLIFAAKYPQFVEKLVIWGSAPHILPNDAEEYDKIRDVNKWSERKRKPLIEVYGNRLQEVHDYYCDAVKEISRRGGDICTSLLKDVQCPTLILHGDKDILVDPTHPTYLLENIQKAKLYRFPDGKHNIHQRYSKEFNDIVGKFILDKF